TGPRKSTREPPGVELSRKPIPPSDPFQRVAPVMVSGPEPPMPERMVRDDSMREGADTVKYWNGPTTRASRDTRLLIGVTWSLGTVSVMMGFADPLSMMTSSVGPGTAPPTQLVEFDHSPSESVAHRTGSAAAGSDAIAVAATNADVIPRQKSTDG